MALYSCIRQIRFAALGIILLQFAGLSAWAQPLESQTPRTLVSGWYESPPLFEYGPNGELAGFGADLSRLLARELDIPLEFKYSGSLPESVQAFANGEIDIIAGVPSRPLSREFSVHSNSVGASRKRLIVRADQQQRISLDSVPPPSVGIVSSGEQLARTALPPHLPLRAYSAPDEGLVALLAKEIDLWFSTEEGSMGWAYRAGIDHMFVPFGDPFADDIRVVGIHKSQIGLQGPINEAIARLEASGELAGLRQRYHLELYAPAPEVLSVGIAHFPPYQYVDEDGSVRGFSVDVIQDLAERTGLEIELREISMQDLLTKGLDWTAYDMLPLLGNTESRRERADFTLPVNDIAHSIFTTSTNVGRFATLDDLLGQRVGVVTKSAGRIIAERHGGLDLIFVNEQQDLAKLLLDGEVDVIVTGKLGFEYQMAAMKLSADIRTAGEPIFKAKGSVALRFGLGEVRERLNSAIPGYLLSPEFAERRRTLEGDPVFWSRTRLWFALGAAAVAALLFLIMGVVLLMNLRARRQAEALTSETLDVSERLNAVMSAARSGIVGFNENGQVAFANPSARRMLGKPDTKVPYYWPENVCFFNETGERILVPGKGSDQRFVRGGELQGELVRMTNLLGSDRLHVRLSSSGIGADRSPQISTVLVLDDVTEAERHREQAEHSSKLVAIGQLTGGIAHDFNNLLAVTLGNLELIKYADSRKEIDRLADLAIVASLKGADLTRNMLAFARKSRLSPEVINLNKVVIETRSWIGRVLRATVTVETDLQADLWQISADRNSTENALLNLIVNARDAMGGRGRLTLETANCCVDETFVENGEEPLAPGRYVVLCVSDTGQGIPSHSLEQIFVPFYTTKAVGQGTGLGLSMVMGFMQQSGGTVRVMSRQGQGTTFKLYFPAAEEPVLTERRKQQPALFPEVDRRILLAEDEEAVREVLESLLKRAGYRVEAVASGDEAVARFKADPSFDMLLTDIVMPGELQGTDLAEALRAIQPTLPVVFMSGYANEELRGDNGLIPEGIHLMKPVQQADLLAAMDKAFSRRSRRASDRYFAQEREPG